MNTLDPETKSQFSALTPEVIIKIAEDELMTPLTGLCRSYNSYINRVYELSRGDKTGVVAKFYRPGRWSKEALQDEHDFLTELASGDIPVIAPLKLRDNKTLGEFEGIYFALFPKKGGRNTDEFLEEEWLEIGRLIGRVHAIGEKRLPRDRVTLTPHLATRDHIDFISRGGFIPKELLAKFRDTAAALIELTGPLFKNKSLIRIHGDCHFANIIYRPGESFYLIDFDDMAVGTPVQDVWMLLPGYVKNSRHELALFIEGYETFRDLNRSDLVLIEPLRAMRYIHFTAWCARQVADGGFTNLAPGWGTKTYWQTEISDLEKQISLIKQDLPPIT
ncbi:MAG: serine/threonine protein kinase [Candidatus Omnitrophica bacterium]|nr:serine/threonine protein kinase [Candidatus Omnitrophota bacterium]